MTQIKLVTYNARGLGDSTKRREIFYYLHKKKFDVIFMQEVHGYKSIEKLWSSQWGSKIWFSHGKSDAKGVAILFNKNLPIQIHNFVNDDNGRFILLYATLFNNKWLLANVYAPNTDSPDFFDNVFSKIDSFSSDNIVLAGDFNLGLDACIDRKGATKNNNLSATKVNKYLIDKQMIDSWRHLHPDDPGYTWRKTRPQVSCSRLDYCCISESLSQFLLEAETIPGFKTDHSLVQIKLSMCEQKRGPGYWKLNCSLLKDIDFLDAMNKLLDIELEVNKFPSAKMRWELIKPTVRGSCIQYTSRKKKATKRKIELLERKIKRLQKELHTPNPLFNDTEEQIRLASHELNELISERAKGAAVRCGRDWSYYAEKPSKYCLNLEKKRARSKTLHRLIRPDGTVVEGQDVLAEIKDFYKKLYTSGGKVCTEFMKDLDIPKLSEELKAKLDAPITMDDISKALFDLNNNRSPGEDGLPCEFYKTFRKKLSHLYYEVVMECIDDSEFHLSARRGIISLLEKLGKNELYLQNWRPLSLLNVDNKLYTKVLANRLQETQK